MVLVEGGYIYQDIGLPWHTRDTQWYIPTYNPNPNPNTKPKTVSPKHNSVLHRLQNIYSCLCITTVGDLK